MAAGRRPEGQPILVWIDPARLPPGAGVLVERAMKTWTDAAGRRLTLQKVPARLGSAQDIGAAPATGLSAGDVQALRKLYGQ